MPRRTSPKKMGQTYEDFVGRIVREYMYETIEGECRLHAITGTVQAFCEDKKTWEVLFDGCLESSFYSFPDIVTMLARDVSNIRDERFCEALNSGVLERICS